MHATVADIGLALDAIDMPWTNLIWPDNDAPPLPYVVLVPLEENGVKADNDTAYSYRRYDVELYTHGRDVALEASVRGAIADAGIPCGLSAQPQMVPNSDVVITYIPTTLIEQEASNG